MMGMVVVIVRSWVAYQEEAVQWRIERRLTLKLAIVVNTGQHGETRYSLLDSVEAD